MMALEINELFLYSTCTGCLSSDRKLTQLSKEEFIIFLELLGPFDKLNDSMLLCWECKALFKKLSKFRIQIHLAQEHLKKHTFPKTLSKLKICKIYIQNSDILGNAKKSKTNNQELENLSEHLDNSIKYEENIENSSDLETNYLIYNITDNCKSNNSYTKSKTKLVQVKSDNIGAKQENIPTNRNLNQDNQLDSDDVRVKVEDTCIIARSELTQLESDDLSVADTQPLAFIKVESDNEDFNDEFDNYDFNSGLVEIKVDDKNLKDKISSANEYKPKIKLKKVKHKSGIEDFNDSDDEPLKKSGKRSKRRKKNGNEVEIHRNTGIRREKPSGVVDNVRVKKKLEQLNVDSGLLQMILLSWEEVEEERQRALLSESFTRHDYRCYDCVVGFNHRFKLDNHMKKHDQANGPSLCSVCRVRFRDGHALAAHRRRHRVRWSCCRCGSRWSRADVAADHAARAHGATPALHECPHCSHKASTLGKLRNHIRSHGERQKCELCGKTFRDRASLRTHLFIHKGEKEYSCPQCGKMFLFKKAMEVHLVTHDAHAHLYCHQCDMNFKNQMSYYHHMKYNLKHIDPAMLKYACHLCDKKFLKATRLEEHNLAVHLKSTPIQCTTQGCNFACSSRPVLRTHIRMVHRNGRAQKNHVCHTCGKAYTTKKTLEGHMRTHTGERPFKCTDCPSTFGYEAALYNHNKLVHLKGKIGRAQINVFDENTDTITPNNQITLP